MGRVDDTSNFITPENSLLSSDSPANSSKAHSMAVHKIHCSYAPEPAENGALKKSAVVARHCSYSFVYTKYSSKDSALGEDEAGLS